MDARTDRHLLERLLRQYWPPVYGHLRREGYQPHDASDLTQEFMASVVLSRDLLGRADPARGRFRAFLKHALKNFVIDHHRSRGRPGGPRRPSAFDPEHEAEASLDTGLAHEPGAEFDRQWATTVVQLALDRLEDALHTDGMARHWAAFDVNVVGPSIRGTTPLPLAELALRIGVENADIASNILQTAKRRFKRTLRDIVMETVSDEHAAAMELRELSALFG